MTLEVFTHLHDNPPIQENRAFVVSITSCDNCREFLCQEKEENVFGGAWPRTERST